MRRIKVNDMRPQKGTLLLRLRPRTARTIGVARSSCGSPTIVALMLNHRGRPVQIGRDQEIPIPPRIPVITGFGGLDDVVELTSCDVVETVVFSGTEFGFEVRVHVVGCRSK